MREVKKQNHQFMAAVHGAEMCATVHELTAEMLR